MSLAELTEANKLGIPVRFYNAAMVDSSGNIIIGEASKFTISATK